MKTKTLRFLAVLLLFTSFVSTAMAQSNPSTSNASLELPTPTASAAAPRPSMTEPPEAVSTGVSYLGGDLGLTYNWYLGESNFLWTMTDVVNDISWYTRFDNVGSGIGGLIGLKGAIALSNSIDLEGKLRYLTNYSSRQESQPLPVSTEGGAEQNVTNNYTLELTNLDLAAILHFALSNRWYAAAGLSYDDVLSNSFTANQTLPPGLVYNDNNLNPTSLTQEAGSFSWSNTFSPSRFDLQLGAGSVFPIGSSNYWLDAELLISVPLSVWMQSGTQSAFNSDVDFFNNRFEAQNFPASDNLAHPTFPNLWYASLTVGLRFPFGEIPENEKSNAGEPLGTKTPSNTNAGLGPDGKVALVGRVTNAKTGAPVNANMTVVDLTNNQVVATDHTNDDGVYSVRVKPGKYSVTADADGYLFGSSYFEVDDEGRILAKHPDIKLDESSGRTRLLVFFRTGKSDLDPSSYPELDRAVRLMKAVPSMQVEIAGYTDNVGAADYNIQLSQRRANAVRDYLIHHGIDKSRVTAKGYGMDSPIADNSTDDGRAENRRVEFVVMSK